MTKIPLHNILASLGIGKIENKQELEALVARLEAYLKEHPDATVKEAVAELSPGTEQATGQE